MMDEKTDNTVKQMTSGIKPQDLDQIVHQLEFCRTFAELTDRLKIVLLGQFSRFSPYMVRYQSSSDHFEFSYDKDKRLQPDKSQFSHIQLLKPWFLELFGSGEVKYEAISGLQHLRSNDQTMVFFHISHKPGSGVIFVFEQFTSDSYAAMQLETCVKLWQLSASWLAKMENAQELVYKDDLTGLYNYRYLEIILETEVRRAHRFNSCFSLMFIDIDNFKSVNDRYGHLNGSSILSQMAEVFRTTLREVDSIIRYGGDEFIILLIGADPDHAYIVSERLRRIIEQTEFELDTGKAVHLTVSIGVSSYPTHALTKKDIIQLADESMYKSKKLGKNKTSIVTAEKILPKSALSRRS